MFDYGLRYGMENLVLDTGVFLWWYAVTYICSTRWILQVGKRGSVGLVALLLTRICGINTSF
jgi:hypothetical protein